MRGIKKKKKKKKKKKAESTGLEYHQRSGHRQVPVAWGFVDSAAYTHNRPLHVRRWNHPLWGRKEGPAAFVCRSGRSRWMVGGRSSSRSNSGFHRPGYIIPHLLSEEFLWDMRTGCISLESRGARHASKFTEARQGFSLVQAMRSNVSGIYREFPVGEFPSRHPTWILNANVCNRET